MNFEADKLKPGRNVFEKNGGMVPHRSGFFGSIVALTVPPADPPQRQRHVFHVIRNGKSEDQPPAAVRCTLVSIMPRTLFGIIPLRSAIILREVQDEAPAPESKRTTRLRKKASRKKAAKKAGGRRPAKKKASKKKAGRKS